MPRSLSSLSPEVDRRLAAWDLIQYRLAANPKVRPTITISRKFGCEGFPLADRVRALAEAATGEPWNVYDKSLLEHVASQEHLPIQLLKSLGDRSRMLEAFGVYATSHMTHDQAFEKVARYVVEVARAGNAVIVGQGGAILCASLRNCFHFRLDAGEAWRVESIMRRLDVPRKEAEHLVDVNSAQRERFIQNVLHADVTDARHYDAVFNNERHPVEAIAAAILDYVRSAWPDRSYFAGART